METYQPKSVLVKTHPVISPNPIGLWRCIFNPLTNPLKYNLFSFNLIPENSAKPNDFHLDLARYLGNPAFILDLSLLKNAFNEISNLDNVHLCRLTGIFCSISFNDFH